MHVYCVEGSVYVIVFLLVSRAKELIKLIGTLLYRSAVRGVYLVIITVSSKPY